MYIFMFYMPTISILFDQWRIQDFEKGVADTQRPLKFLPPSSPSPLLDQLYMCTLYILKREREI